MSETEVPTSKTFIYPLSFQLHDTIKKVSHNTFTNLQDLKDHTQTLFNEIEAYSVYKNDFNQFPEELDTLLNSLEKHFENLNMRTGNEDLRLEQIKIDQTLHSLTHHKTSSASNLVETAKAYCLDARFCNVLYLYIWKEKRERIHQKDDDMHLLIKPYLLFLKEMGTEFLEPFRRDKTRIQSVLEKQYKTLQENIDSEPNQNLNLLDHDQVAEEIRGLYKQILKKEPLSSSDYYAIGLCSFIVHLLKFAKEEDSTFLNICFLSDIVVRNLKELPQNHIPIVILTDLQGCKLQLQSWISFLNHTKESLKKFEELSHLKQVQILQEIECLLEILKEENVSEVTQEVKTCLQEFETLLFNTLEKKCPVLEERTSFLEGFLNNREALLNLLLSLTNLDNRESIVSRITTLKQGFSLRSFLLKRYYQELKKLAETNPVTQKDFFEKLNLSGLSLQELLDSEVDLKDLQLHLQTFIQFLKNQSHKKEAEIIPWQEASRICLAYVQDILEFSKSTTSSSQKLEKLKVLGQFFLQLVSITNQEPMLQAKPQFLSAFIPFIQKHYQPGELGLFKIEKVLCETLSNVKDVAIKQEAELAAVFALLEETFARDGFSKQTVPEGRLFWSNPQFIDVFYNIILSSLGKIESNLQKLSNVQIIENLRSAHNPIKLECSQLVLSTIPWLERLLPAIEDQEKRCLLFKKLNQIYFSPAIFAFTKQNAKHPVTSKLSSLILNIQLKEWQGHEIFLQEILEHLELGQRFIAELEKGENAALSNLPIYQEEFSTIIDTTEPNDNNSLAMMLSFQSCFFNINQITNQLDPTVALYRTGWNFTSSSEPISKLVETLFEKLFDSTSRVTNLKRGTLTKTDVQFFEDTFTILQKYFRVLADHVEEVNNVISNKLNSFLHCEKPGENVQAFLLFAGLAHKIEKEISIRALVQPGSFKLLVNRLAKMVNSNIRSLDDLELLFARVFQSFTDVVETLIVNLGDLPSIFGFIKHRKTNKISVYDRSQQIEEYFKGLFDEMQQSLEAFPFREMISKDCMRMNSLFKQLLAMFEQYYWKLKEIVESNINSTQALMSRKEEDIKQKNQDVESLRKNGLPKKAKPVEEEKVEIDGFGGLFDDLDQKPTGVAESGELPMFGEGVEGLFGTNRKEEPIVVQKSIKKDEEVDDDDGYIGLGLFGDPEDDVPQRVQEEKKKDADEESEGGMNFGGLFDAFNEEEKKPQESKPQVILSPEEEKEHAERIKEAEEEILKKIEETKEEVSELKKGIEIKKSFVKDLETRFLSRYDLFCLFHPVAISKAYSLGPSNTLNPLLQVLSEVSSRNLPSNSNQTASNEVPPEKTLIPFTELQSTVASDLITMKIYLDLLVKFMDTRSSNDIPDTFVLNICEASVVLLKKWIEEDKSQRGNTSKTEKEHDFPKKLQDMISSLALLFHSFWTYFLKNDLELKERRNAITEWVSIIVRLHYYLKETSSFSLLDPHLPLTTHVLSIAKFGWKYEPVQIRSLLLEKENSLIGIILSFEMNTPIDKILENLIVFHLNCLFEDSLPKDLMVELAINRNLLRKRMEGKRATLSDLLKTVYTPSVGVELEFFTSVLLRKFSVEPSSKTVIKDTNEENANKLEISFGMLNSFTNRQFALEKVLNSMSEHSNQAIDLLINQIVENFFWNCSLLQNATPETEFKFRDIRIILRFLSFCPHVNIYLTCKKSDFRPIVSKYLGSAFFLDNNSLSLEEFSSISALDCLFKIKFFTYSFVNSTFLALILVKNTGVIIPSFEEQPVAMDFSYLVTHRFLNEINRQLEELNQAIEHPDKKIVETYLALTGLGKHFLGIKKILAQQYNTTQMQEYFTPVLLTIEKNLIQTFSLFYKQQSDQVQSLEFVEEDLFADLNEHINAQSIKDLFNKEPVNFVDSLKHFSEIQAQINVVLKSVAVSNDPSSSESERISPDDIKQSVDPKILYAGGEVVSDTNWFPATNKWIEFANKFPSFYKFVQAKYPEESSCLFANANHYLSGMDLQQPTRKMQMPNQALLDKVNFTFAKNYKMNQVKKQKSSKFEEFWNIVTTQFPETAQRLRSEDKLPQEEKKENNVIEKEEKQPENMVEKIEEKETKIVDYFFHTDLKDKEGFIAMKSNISRKIKQAMEDAKMSAIAQEADKAGFEKLALELILKNQAEDASSFEKNLTMIYIEELGLGSSYTFPENFSKIKREWRFLHSDRDNLDTFLSTIESLQGGDTYNERTLTDEERKEVTDVSGSYFCTDAMQSLPAGTDQNNNSNNEDLLTRYKELKDNVFPVDDQLVESLLGLFFISLPPGQNEVKSVIPQKMNILKALCSSPLFALKFFDSLFFILYCPSYVFNNFSQFPFAKISNLDLQEWYAIVYKNIFSFLDWYIPGDKNIPSQPRVFFEQNGLERIKTIRASTTYPNITQKLVSFLDLLAGLLHVPEFVSDNALKSKVGDLCSLIIVQNQNLRIIEVKEGEELMERANVISVKTSNKLSEFSTCFESLQKFPAFVYSLPHTAIDTVVDLMMKISPVLEETLVDLKTKKASDQTLESSDLDKLSYLQSSLEEFERSLSKWSFALSADLKKVKRDQKGVVLTEEDNKILQDCNKFLQKLFNRLLKEEQFENFIIHLLETANICSTTAFKDNYQIQQLVNICIHFFFFLACQAQFNKTSRKVSDDVDALPTLSKVISKEPVYHRDPLPEISMTFSHLRISREFDFEVLLADLCKKQTKCFQEHYRIYDEEDYSKTEMLELIIMITRSYPLAIEFSIKRAVLKFAIKQERENLGIQDYYFQIDIVRTRFIDSTLEAFTNTTTNDLKKETEIKYHEEEGFDGGGLTREWLTLLSKELFDPETGLFRLSENKASIQPSPLAHLLPHHLRLFELAGIIIAKAIRDQNTIDVTFTKSFLKHIKNQKIVFSDLEDIDLDLSKNLHWILENSVEDLELTFTYETEILGQKITRELIPNGHDTAVTDENKKEYVKMVCESKMRDEIKEEISAFLHGFHRVMHPFAMELFNVSEIQLLIAGVPEIKVEELKKLSEVSGFDGTDMEQWLWEILGEFSQKDLAAFMYFFSGSLKLGYASTTQYRFVYSYRSTGCPIAHTCYTEMEIPMYQSKEEFKTKLLFAIYEGHQGFYMN